MIWLTLIMRMLLGCRTLHTLFRITLAVSIGSLLGSCDRQEEPKIEGGAQFEKLRFDAEMGDLAAQYGLAMAYLLGAETPVDRELAEVWCKKAAEQGAPKAQFQYAYSFLSGDDPQGRKDGNARPSEAAKWYQKAADQQVPEAQYYLGLAHKDGKGLPQDDTLAIKWLLDAESSGCRLADNDLGVLRYLGDCFFYGRGIEVDAAKAVGRYLKAAENGDAKSQLALGKCYYDGTGLEKNDSKSFGWYQKAAEQGDCDAIMALGAFYASGIAVDKNEKEALKWFQKAADADFPAGAYWVAVCYANGAGVTADQEEALKWCLKAAEQGMPMAQFIAGAAYLNGRGVSQNDKEAAKWYLKSAEQGWADAQNGLAFLYEQGKGVPQNLTQAGYWYRKAAEQGYALSQQSLAYFLEFGKGTTRDLEEAFKWYVKAAEQGLPMSQYALGYCYSAGEGVEKDLGKGFKWYLKAAMQGDKESCYEVGLCYRDGIGVEKEKGEAGRWLKLAAGQGHALAQLHFGKYLKEAEQNKEAIEWIQKSADQGIATACYELGLHFLKGSGHEDTDSHEGVKWLRIAAEKGCIAAKVLISECYRNGIGVPKDLSESFKWFVKAAAGDRLIDEEVKPIADYRKAATSLALYAQYEVSRSYANGKGVKKDQKLAAKWLQEAANGGLTIAQSSIGRAYLMGQLGIQKNGVEAVKWLRRAAEKGDAGAQINIGYCYDQGIGMVKNQVEAYKWSLLAAAQGGEQARKNTDIAERNYNPQVIAEGRRLAQEWEATHASSNKEESMESKENKTNGEKVSKPANKLKQTGTGFFITENGYFITNHHVVDGAKKIQIKTSEGIVDAVIIRLDEAMDLALLKAEGTFKALPVSDSRSTRLGATVATLGFPSVNLMGFEPKLSKGEISSLAGLSDDAKHFQISVSVQPGSSGGPLFDVRGNVVGVILSQLDQKAALRITGTLAQNVNYAIKGSYLTGFLESIPDASRNLLPARGVDKEFEEVVDDVRKATILVLGYGPADDK